MGLYTSMILKLVMLFMQFPNGFKVSLDKLCFTYIGMQFHEKPQNHEPGHMVTYSHYAA